MRPTRGSSERSRSSPHRPTGQRCSVSPGGVRSATPSSFSDATLAALLADGRTMDLVTRTNLLNCPHVFPPAATPCTAAQMDHAAGERPWGSNNPRWRLYANGRLSALAAESIPRSMSLSGLQMTPPRTDGDPARDGTDTSNPGAGILQVRSEAFGPGGARRAVEATLARAGTGLRIISWRLVR